MNSPKHFFLQLGIIATLYASIVSFISFLFEVINNVLPDFNAYYYDISNSSLRFSVSVLLVMFPLFIFLSHLYRKAVGQTPELSDSKMRKWLVYFTLFLAGLTIAIDLIVLINRFLGGETFTLAFGLKVFVVLAVALKVFYFYLQDLKGAWDSNPRKVKWIAAILSFLVLICVVSGIILIGSPSKQRDIVQDRDRVSALANIQQQLISFYQAKGKLPAVLDELNDPLSGMIVPTDPETGEAFGYKVTSKLSFELCATFKTPSAKPQSSNSYTYPSVLGEEHFQHEVGVVCFPRTIDPEKFPVNKKV